MSNTFRMARMQVGSMYRQKFEEAQAEIIKLQQEIIDLTSSRQGGSFLYTTGDSQNGLKNFFYFFYFFLSALQGFS